MKKVLVADDTKSIRTLLSTCLEIEGYEVITAIDGNQALNMIIGEKPDIVFLDIKMPYASGTEVLRKIREAGINTPVIIMTAFATIKNAVECTKLGAVAYLQKPFSAEKVKSVLDVFMLENEQYQHISSVYDYITSAEKLIEEGNLCDALNQLKKAISIDPSNARLYFLFGKVYEGLGDTQNANKFFDAFNLFA